MNYFNKSMKINPKHASALNNLGVSLYKFKYVKYNNIILSIVNLLLALQVLIKRILVF